MKNTITKSKAGFTVVESLVAITLLLLSIAGPMTLVVQGLRSAYYSSTQMTAFYLAQDAIEYVRNIRDTNNLAHRSDSSVSWLKGLEVCTATTEGQPLATALKCQIDTTVVPTCGATGCTATGATNCAGGVCAYLKLDTTTARYQYTTGNTSLYKREIQIVPLPSGVANGDGEAFVNVTVTWQASPFFPVKTIRLKTNLVNWQS